MNDSETIYDFSSRTLLCLKKRPKMFFKGELTFTAVETYINGYLLGLECCLGITVFQRLHVWFQEKIKQENNVLGFTTHVDYYYKERSEEDRISILIDLVDEFLKGVLVTKSIE